MSELNPISVEILPVEVLLMIFQHLDAQDLLNCELVCRRWRMALGPGPFWKLAFHKQIDSSRMWRKVYRTMDFIEWSCVNVQCYNKIYKIFNHCAKEIDKNWRTLQFSTTVFSAEEFDWNHFSVDDDFCGCLNDDGDEVVYFELPSLDVTRSIEINAGDDMQILKDMVVVVDEEKIKVFDSHSGHQIRELRNDNHDDWSIYDAFLKNDQIVVLFYNGETDESRLAVWAFQGPLETTPLKEWIFEGSRNSLIVDEFYIFAEIEGPKENFRDVNWRTVVHFICVKTLEIERTMSFFKKDLHYGKGLLLIVDHEHRVRILHVASGTYFHDLNTQGLCRYAHFSFSSKHLVVISTEDVFKLNIYDLKSRNPSVDPEIPLLASAEIPPTTYRVRLAGSRTVWMDGTRLIFYAPSTRRSAPKNVLLLDFAEAAIDKAEWYLYSNSLYQGN